jgi:predicted lipoprotein with Yx(FWY)xxD motif
MTTMGTKRRMTLAGTATVAGLMLAACGTAGNDTARPNAEAQVPVAATTAPGNAPAVEQGAPVAAAQRWKGWLVLSDAQNPVLGTIVVNGKGHTVYRFDADTTKPSVSNCSGACARLWPPVRFTKKLKLKGIPRSAIGNIMTKDGICQATVNGRPAYTYAKDTAPGQINGQGIGGTWFAMAPDGSKAGGGLVPGSPDGGSGSYGY